MARKLSALAVLAAAVPLLWFSMRSAWAAWLVPPVAYLDPATPTGDPALLDYVQRLVPGEAFYPYFEAQVHRDRMHAGWLGPEATAHGERAAQAAARAITIAPTNPQFHLLAGIIDLERARIPGAGPAQSASLRSAGIAALEQAVALNFASPLVAQAAGMAMLQSFAALDANQREETLDLLATAAAGDVATLRPVLEVLRSVAPPGSLLELAERIAPDTAPARTILADFLVDSGMFEAGLKQYVDAAELDDLDLSLLNRAVGAANRAPATAREALRVRLAALTAAHPRSPQAWLALGLAIRRDAAPAEREAALDEAVRYEDAAGVETRVAIRRERAAILRDLGDLDGALADLEAAQQAAPRNPDVLVELAQALDRTGRADEALSRYEEAVRVAPASPAARQALAQAYLDRFEYLDAIEQWQAIVARDRNAIAPRLFIARAYTTMGLRDQALRYYTEILELQPDNAAARREMQAITGRLPDLER